MGKDKTGQPDNTIPPDPISGDVLDSGDEKLCNPHSLASTFYRWRRWKQAPWDLVYWHGDWWLWGGRKYRLVPDSDLRADLTGFVDQEIRRRTARANRSKKEEENKLKVPDVTTGLINNVRQALISMVTVSASVEQPAWIRGAEGRASVIALANGLVDIESLIAGNAVVEPHSSNWFSPTCLDFGFDPAAECTLFQTYLREVLEDDDERIALCQEWYGYQVTPDTTMHKALFAVGDGGNGKSVWADVLIGMLGPDNVSGVPLEAMAKPFQQLPMVGKLANIVTEIGDVGAIDEGVLKAYIGGDRLYIDRKHREGIHVRPTARLTFLTNSLPRFTDRSLGLWRRLLILPFSVTISEERKDRGLAAKLLTELAGIFNWSIVGLRRLRLQGKFTESAVCRAAVAEYQRDLDPARVFLTDHVERSPLGRVESGTLFQAYKWWCEDNNYRALNASEFGKAVPRVLPSARRVRSTGADKSRPWVYVGIVLLAEPTTATPVNRPQAVPFIRTVTAADDVQGVLDVSYLESDQNGK